MADVEITAQIWEELGWEFDPPKARRRRMKDLFVKGPLPLEWLARVDVGAHTTTVALIVKMMVDMNGGGPVHVPGAVWQLFGLSRDSRRRALEALEAVGTVRIKRCPGQALKIWLLDTP